MDDFIQFSLSQILQVCIRYTCSLIFRYKNSIFHEETNNTDGTCVATRNNSPPAIHASAVFIIDLFMNNNIRCKVAAHRFSFIVFSVCNFLIPQLSYILLLSNFTETL